MSSENAQSTYTVLVTGITGFLGATLTNTLLQYGHTVHGTTRPSSLSLLQSLPFCSHANLQVFHVDLSDPPDTVTDALSKAAKGCSHALHTAAPTDPSEDVSPITNGAMLALRAFARMGVSRTVYVSSSATLGYGDHCGKRALDESDWNTEASPSFLPHDHAKTAAEREVMRFAAEEGGAEGGGGMEVAILNPAVMWGRSLVDRGRCSFAKQFLVKLARGEMKGILDVSISVVHVCDVAEACRRLAFDSRAQGRFVCCPDRPLVHLRDMAEVLCNAGLDVPLRDLTSRSISRMIRMSSHVYPGGVEGQYVRKAVGNHVMLSNKRLVNEVGLQFEDVANVLLETVDEVIEMSYV